MRGRITNALQELTGHSYIFLTSRGNTAIEASLSLVEEGKKVLLPAEGGWLGYQTIPRKLHLPVQEVPCVEARINVDALASLLRERSYGLFIYQQPGGYFAEQPARDIYKLCREAGCLVVMDVSGCIGTPFCEGSYADMMVCSFGHWKLLEVGEGGFLSSQRNFSGVIEKYGLKKEAILPALYQSILHLPQRLRLLEEKRKAIIQDLYPLAIVRKDDFGLVVIVRYASEEEKEKILAYCRQRKLEWTECPRFIRLKEKALSIEVKR